MNRWLRIKEIKHPTEHTRAAVHTYFKNKSEQEREWLVVQRTEM